ncbi:MAG TPA: 5-(carboxyamino)imidazole ribonucleotide mutase [Thermoplasmatales archaeon]|nr:5-(carboxyamino)imidazole ribonucleotide mutase [Thermoplasmatales archaeon]
MKIHILLGSKSDSAVGDKIINTLKQFDIEYKLDVASAHRTPDRVKSLVEESDADVFIGVAGLAAALPGSIAAHTTKPVVGVPVSGKVNLDSILSIVQMPPGIPVAAVGLDRGDNAALLAVEICALKDQKLAKQLEEYRERMRKKVTGE